MLSRSTKFVILIIFLSSVRSENLESGENCLTFNNSEGICVSINECKILEDQLRNRTIEIYQAKVCNNATRFVCCPTESISSRLNLNKSKIRNFLKIL
jgi:hypothetical protein